MENKPWKYNNLLAENNNKYIRIILKDSNNKEISLFRDFGNWISQELDYQKDLFDNEDESYDEEYDDILYEMNGLMGDLQAELPMPPKTVPNNVKYAYKYKAYKAIKNIIDELVGYIHDWTPFELKIIEVKNPNIIWEDDYQIAYV